MAEAVAVGGRDVLALEKKYAGVNFAELISSICARLGVTHLLSYGYGTSWLFRNLKVPHRMKLQQYYPEHDSPPVPAEMVVCLDVFGYEDAAPIFTELEKLTESVLFATVRITEEDYHPFSWWFEQFEERFDVHNFQVIATDEAFFICYAKPALVESNGGDIIVPGGAPSH